MLLSLVVGLGRAPKFRDAVDLESLRTKELGKHCPLHTKTHTHIHTPNYTSRKCDNVRLMVRIGALSSPLPNVFAAPMNDQCWVELKTCQVPRTLNDLAILGNAFMRQS